MPSSSEMKIYIGLNFGLFIICLSCLLGFFIICGKYSEYKKMPPAIKRLNTSFFMIGSITFSLNLLFMLTFPGNKKEGYRNRGNGSDNGILIAQNFMM
jgi:hypothetical protein